MAVSGRNDGMVTAKKATFCSLANFYEKMTAIWNESEVTVPSKKPVFTIIKQATKVSLLLLKIGGHCGVKMANFCPHEILRTKSGDTFSPKCPHVVPH